MMQPGVHFLSAWATLAKLLHASKHSLPNIEY